MITQRRLQTSLFTFAICLSILVNQFGSAIPVRAKPQYPGDDASYEQLQKFLIELSDYIMNESLRRIYAMNFGRVRNP